MHADQLWIKKGNLGSIPVAVWKSQGSYFLRLKKKRQQNLYNHETTDLNQATETGVEELTATGYDEPQMNKHFVRK